MCYSPGVMAYVVVSSHPSEIKAYIGMYGYGYVCVGS
jgi:hypothetical protein